MIKEFEDLSPLLQELIKANLTYKFLEAEKTNNSIHGLSWADNLINDSDIPWHNVNDKMSKNQYKKEHYLDVDNQMVNSIYCDYWIVTDDEMTNIEEITEHFIEYQI